MNRIEPLRKDKLYHVYNRGLNKQQIFFCQRDYEKFYDGISKYRGRFPDIEIFAWCFLPNHFHFLMIDHSSNSKSSNWSRDLSKFMQKLQQSYATFFNAKYGESVKKGLKGPIFEGRFKAKPVEDEDYLYHLKRYIEWNAVKHDIVDKPEEWTYSSYAPKMYEEGPCFEKSEFDPYFE